MTLVVPPMPDNATNRGWLLLFGSLTIVAAVLAAVLAIMLDIAEAEAKHKPASTEM